MRPLTHARIAAKDGAGVAFDLDRGWTARLAVLDDDLFRLRLVPPGGPREPRTWAIAPGGADVPWEGRDRDDLAGFRCPPFRLDERADGVELATSRLVANVRLAPFGITWRLPDGRVLAADRATAPYEAGERRPLVRHAMAREPGHQFFGLGDKTGPLDKAGRRFRTLALDALGHDPQTSDPLYKHWPFLITRDPSLRVAFGQYYDTLAPATFELGSEYDNYHGFYRYAEIDDGDLDVYLFPGPRVRDVVRRFAWLTGNGAFGPRWSLGYANTAMSLADAPDAQARLAAFADEAKRHDVPISAFHFGSGYTSRGPRRYVFTWNRDKFPDPEAAVAKFRAQGMRVVANVKPCLLDDHPAWREVAGAGAFVADGTGAPCIGQFWDGQGAHVDFTHPAGVAWWQRSLAREVLGRGIDAAWNDNNEYEIWDEDGRSHGFGAPIPIARSRPLHALLMTRASAEAQAAHRPHERVYTVTRAGPPGIARYAQTWSGDNTTGWHTLRWNIRMGLSMSLSGLFDTGHDVGGFAGPVPDPELLLRWVQNGCFSPRFLMNSWKAGGEVNSPWLHREVAEPIRAAIRFRYRLLPYLYTLYRRAATEGEPMLRPTFLDFEDDPATFADSDDFMLGPNLLVASVVEPLARSRTVYLPAGPACWYEFDTGRAHPAGATVGVPAPLERIPLFVPAGAMIPLTDTDDTTRLHDEPSRRLLVFPAPGAARSTFALYEDDGVSHRHREGDRAEVTFTLESDPAALRLHADKQGPFPVGGGRVRIVVVPPDARPLALSGDGIELFF